MYALALSPHQLSARQDWGIFRTLGWHNAVTFCLLTARLLFPLALFGLLVPSVTTMKPIEHVCSKQRTRMHCECTALHLHMPRLRVFLSANEMNSQLVSVTCRPCVCIAGYLSHHSIAMICDDRR